MAGDGPAVRTPVLRLLLVLAGTWLWLAPSMAQPQPMSQPAAPAASAASAAASAPAMAVVGEWQGPFQQTKILKLVDAEDGVACYLYVPSNVPSNTVCTGQTPCAIHYPSGIGNMSCVKVREPQTAAKPAAKPAPRR